MTPLMAFKHACRNRNDIMASRSCGCFHCCAIFGPSDIKEWAGKRKAEQFWTALCPKCGDDTVLGDKSGYPITQESLAKMRDYWYAEEKKP